jgi:hypothetical protein
MAKSRWKGKNRYCVSAGAPGYGTRIQRCFHKKANATKLCKVLREKGNRCTVIGKAKTGGKRHCLKWSKPRR